jgi:hypothetical protein
MVSDTSLGALGVDLPRGHTSRKQLTGMDARAMLRKICSKGREEDDVKLSQLILQLIDEAYEKKTWHGPNLKQALKGITGKEAAWRLRPDRHNIWEETLHAAYWKYRARRRIQGGKRGNFPLKGGNFFARPEKGNMNEIAWRNDKELLEQEHRALRACVVSVLKTPQADKLLPTIYGVAFHDVYHAGQIRLLRRFLQKKSMGRGEETYRPFRTTLT